MKICLLFEDAKYSDTAYLYPEKGNDGLPGTQYEYAFLAKFLCINYPNDQIYMVHSEINNIYSGINDYVYRNIEDAFRFIKSENIDVVIYTVGQSDDWYKMLEEYDYNIPFIAWDHNHISYKELVKLRKCNKIKRVVCCGKELYDMYIDDEIIHKMTYIFNMLDSDMYPQRKETVDYNVTFLGAITPQKGFHILAKQWKNILKQVPQAQMYVAGSGALYDKDSVLGKYGIAEKEYEEEFMPYLVNEKGEIMESVHFLGVIGKDEKMDLFSKTKVGVANPSGLTETFCLSAVEFSSAGVPVVSRKEYGLLDTVKNGETGLLSTTEREFCNDVVKLLNDDNLNTRFGRNGKQFVKDHFHQDIIIKEWREMIENVVNNVPTKVQVPKDNYFNRMKWLRIINYYIKKIWFFRKLPSMMDYNNIRKIISGIKK